MIEVLEREDKRILEKISELEKNIFQDSAYKIEVLLGMLEKDEYKFIVEKDNEKILGYLILHDAFDIFEIMKIAVIPEMRGKGIGEKLLEKYFQLENKNLFLEVREKNMRAINFYKKNKFEIVGKRKNYYSDGENAILMLLEKINFINF